MWNRIVFAICLLSAHQAASASTGKGGCKDDQGVTHSVGHKWQPNACTFCQCLKTGDKPLCASQSCAPLECPEGMVPELPNEKTCCPSNCVDLSTSLVAEDCQTVCSTKWEPVCGNDGSTYTNLCHLQLAQCVRNDPDFKVKHDGECTEEEEAAAKKTKTSKPASSTTTSKPKPTPTTTNKPVKSMGVQSAIRLALPGNMVHTTVSEKSNLEAMTAGVLSTTAAVETGAATAEEDCSAVTCPAREKCQPGSRLAADEDAPCCKVCVEDDKCPKICLKSFDPVCGTDGQTYASLCDMMSIACEQGLNIEAASKGSCEETGPRPVQPPQAPGDCGLVVCSLDYTPVCGSDGITYDNLCKLGMASCMAQKAGGESLYLASSGPCGSAEGTSAVSSEARGTTATAAPTATESPASATGGSLSGETPSSIIVEPDSSSDSSTRAVAIGVSVALGIVVLCAVMVGAGIVYTRARRNRKARKAAAKPSIAPSELPMDGNASAISTVQSGPAPSETKKYSS